MSQKSETKKNELSNIDIPSTLKVEQIKISSKEILNIQIKPKENQSNHQTRCFQLKQNQISPSDYFKPKTTTRDSAFFDTSLSLIDLGDYMDIEGILHKQSLILTKNNTQDETKTEVEQNQD